MTARQYLNRVRRIDEDITELLETKVKAREALTRMTQNYKSDGAQMTADPHKFERLAVLDYLIDELVDKQIETKAEILATISKLKDNRLRILVEKYYINLKPWEQVAAEMHYSYSHLMRMHGYALYAVEELLKDEIE